MTVRLAIYAAVVASLAGTALGASQQSTRTGQPPPQVSVGHEPLRLTIPTWIDTAPPRLGVLTVTQPERRGEVVQFSLPIGGLTMRAAQAIGEAQHRRAEQKARREVAQALKDFQAAQR